MVVPDFDGAGDIKIALSNLQAGIGQCLFAAAKESSRYAINGVLWEIKDKKLMLVATDGRRLARCRINLASAPDEKIAATKRINSQFQMLLVALALIVLNACTTILALSTYFYQ